jgi:predicted amino acid racemase
MSRYIPVQGHSSLVRDLETNALINTNSAEIAQARERKRIRKQKEQELSERITALEADMSEIKQGIQLLISKTYK